MDIVGQFFRVLCKKISTGREKLAPIDWHDWHAFATLLMNRGSCNHHFLEANHQDMELVKSLPLFQNLSFFFMSRFFSSEVFRLFEALSLLPSAIVASVNML